MYVWFNNMYKIIVFWIFGKNEFDKLVNNELEIVEILIRIKIVIG